MVPSRIVHYWVSTLLLLDRWKKGEDGREERGGLIAGSGCVLGKKSLRDTPGRFKTYMYPSLIQLGAGRGLIGGQVGNEAVSVGQWESLTR